MQGSVGDLSPSHLILANLILPWDPRTEGQQRVKQNTSVCLTQVGYGVSCKRKSTLLLETKLRWECLNVFFLIVETCLWWRGNKFLILLSYILSLFRISKMCFGVTSHWIESHLTSGFEQSFAHPNLLYPVQRGEGVGCALEVCMWRGIGDHSSPGSWFTVI